MAETGYRILNGVVVVTPGNLTAKDMEEIFNRCY